MARVLSSRWLALLCAIALVLGSAGSGRAEHKKVTQYKATVHKDGKEQEQTFDLTKEEHRKELKHRLDEGEVEALNAERERSLMELRADLGLWTIVVFVLLYLILRKYAWGPMLEGLQRREDNIVGALADAQKARDEAKAIRDQLKQEYDKANEKVRELMDEARKNAESLAGETMARAKAEIQEEKGRLKRELKMEFDQALKTLYTESVQLATLLSAKTIRRQLSPEDHRRLVEEAVAELKQAGDSFQRTAGNGSNN